MKPYDPHDPEEGRTAHHEGGHAVWAYHVGRRFIRISIVPDKDGVGGIDIKDYRTRADMEIYLAGTIAECHFGIRDEEETITAGTPDWKKALAIARELYGPGAEDAVHRAPYQIQALLTGHSYWAGVHALATALRETEEKVIYYDRALDIITAAIRARRRLGKMDA